jgi:hypothetical protein
MAGPTREDTYAISVTVFRPDNSTVPIIKGIWDKMSGGEIDSEETIYHPGGMEDPVSLGGRKSVGNVTLTRLYRLGRDHDAIQSLINAVGKSKVTISKQPLDIDGNVYGRPIVYNGILKRISPPDTDSEASGAGLIEMEVTVDGFPSA